MSANKVTINGKTILDLTQDTVTPATLAKGATAHDKSGATIVGTSTIISSNLTANRALVSNANGEVAVSAVTATELGYLDGVTSNIQTQLNGKLSTAPVTSVNGQTGDVTVSVPTVPSTTNILKGNGSGGLVAATRGSDYIASGNIVKQTLVATETTPAENYAINWVYG